MNAVEEALTRLAEGGVVAAATESFFGLLADATRADAIGALLSLKPRGADKGMPLLLPARHAWLLLVNQVPGVASRLADRCWPGPLTIALSAAPNVDTRLTLGGTVAVRLAGPSPAAELAARFGRPLTATSANLPGAPPTVDSETVVETFRSAIVARRLHVLRGRCPGGLPSSIVLVDPDGSWRLVREGSISMAELQAVLG